MAMLRARLVLQGRVQLALWDTLLQAADLMKFVVPRPPHRRAPVSPWLGGATYHGGVALVTPGVGPRVPHQMRGAPHGAVGRGARAERSTGGLRAPSRPPVPIT